MGRPGASAKDPDHILAHEGFHDSPGIHAADLLDLGAGYRLPVGNNGKGLESGS
jgi:hypothetical protein